MFAGIPLTGHLSCCISLLVWCLPLFGAFLPIKPFWYSGTHTVYFVFSFFLFGVFYVAEAVRFLGICDLVGKLCPSQSQ
jgi:hypothetical protein